MASPMRSLQKKTDTLNSANKITMEAAPDDRSRANRACGGRSLRGLDNNAGKTPAAAVRENKLLLCS